MPADRNVPFVLPWYRFSELDALPPADRGALVEDAAERATSDIGVLAGWALTLALIAGIAANFSAALSRWHPAWLLPAALLCFVPLFFYRRRVVRRWVRQLIAQREQGQG